MVIGSTGQSDDARSSLDSSVAQRVPPHSDHAPESSVIVWAQKHLVMSILVVVASAGATYGALKVLLIDRLQDQIAAGQGKSDTGDVATRLAIDELKQGQRATLDALAGIIATLKTPASAPQAASKATRFLGREYDKSGADIVFVSGADEVVRIGRGESKRFRVNLDKNGYFYWDSDESNFSEKTRPSWSETNVVVCIRSSDSRDIVWECFHED